MMKLLDREITLSSRLKIRVKILTLVFVLVSTLGYAQSDNAAKIEYENAEEAFANKNYSLALEKIKKTEQLLKKANPKTQYMTIMILNSMANQYESEKKYQDALRSLEAIEPLISTYLKLDIADQQKYRDVYNIKEEVSNRKRYIQKRIDIKTNLKGYLQAYYVSYNKTFEKRGTEQIQILLNNLPKNMTEYMSSLSEKQRKKKVSKEAYTDDYYYKGFAFTTELIFLYDYENELLKQGICKFKNGKFIKIALNSIGVKENGDVASVEYYLGVNMDKQEKIDILANDFMTNFMKFKPDFRYEKKYSGTSSGDCYVWYFKGYSLEMEKRSGIIVLKLSKHFSDNEIAQWAANSQHKFTIEGENFIVPVSELKDLIDSN